MDRTEYLLLILGMTLVTYIPRMLPFFLLNRMKFGAKIRKFLKLIPYTAITALIFPGVLLVDASRPAIGIMGALAAGLAAWRRWPVMACVLLAIGVDFLLYLAA